MALSATQKETIEYDAKFLGDWNTYCDAKGYVKRQASHACRIAFMKMSAEERERVMVEAVKSVFAGKGRKA